MKYRSMKIISPKLGSASLNKLQGRLLIEIFLHSEEKCLFLRTLDPSFFFGKPFCLLISFYSHSLSLILFFLFLPFFFLFISTSYSLSLSLSLSLFYQKALTSGATWHPSKRLFSAIVRRQIKSSSSFLEVTWACELSLALSTSDRAKYFV